MGGAAEYQKILGISERMLSAAKNGRWDDLAPLEKEYSAAVLANSPDETVSPDLVRSILDNDAKIKELIKARMEDLAGALSSVSQAIKVKKAYR